MPSKLVSFIPSFITLLNLSAGTLAIILLDLYWSPRLIILAAIFDLLDGAVARALNATSDLGKELDSLADMVSFGIAPAVIYWLLAPNPEYWLILAPIFLVCASAWRLAKFNILPSTPYFLGLATPASALLIVGFAMGIHWGSPLLLDIFNSVYAYLFIALFITWSMNRKRVMISFKGIKNQWKWFVGLGLVSIAVLIIDYRLALSGSIVLYILLCEVKELLTPTQL